MIKTIYFKEEPMMCNVSSIDIISLIDPLSNMSSDIEEVEFELNGETVTMCSNIYTTLDYIIREVKTSSDKLYEDMVELHNTLGNAAADYIKIICVPNSIYMVYPNNSDKDVYCSLIDELLRFISFITKKLGELNAYMFAKEYLDLYISRPSMRGTKTWRS